MWLFGSSRELPARLEEYNLSEEETSLASLLLEAGQEHLFANWPSPADRAGATRFFSTIRALEASYPGGMRAYASTARKLLAEAKDGLNPLDGWTPRPPAGEVLTFGSESYESYERIGMAQLGRCGFVLVAGGLGERLGYSGIKVALPTQITTGECYLSWYCRQILSAEHRATLAAASAPVRLPLAIMVSEDTAERTRALLEKESFFGLDPSQVTLMKQEKVACLEDDTAAFALDPHDVFSLLTKPHGHGDVHTLLHSTGTLRRWGARGIRHVYFFQDTNALAFKVLPACLGVSHALKLEVNSVAIARTPGEAIGGIMKLEHKDGRRQTVNVEYNQIDALLKATVEPRGDVAGADGFSPWPGSINQLIFALEPYAETLARTNGTMPEFVNPKYADKARSRFKAPTRLECMMQDYPKSLAATAKVGFCVVKKTTSFSPVKTNLTDALAKCASRAPTYSAPSGEADFYASACEMLAAAGVGGVLEAGRGVSRGGVHVRETPRVVIDPSFGLSLAEWRARLPSPERVRLSAGATLVLRGDCSRLKIEELALEGALLISICPGASVTIHRLREQNKGWRFAPLPAAGGAHGAGALDESLAIRGYTLVREGQRELVFDTPGEYVVDDGENDACWIL